jgi:hypothetical protein
MYFHLSENKFDFEIQEKLLSKVLNCSHIRLLYLLYNHGLFFIAPTQLPTIQVGYPGQHSGRPLQ